MAAKKIDKKVAYLKHVTVLFAYLLIVWGFYRFMAFKLPEEIEEVIIKPLVWLIPVAYFLKKEKEGLSSVGVTTKNLLPSIYLALILGVIFTIEAFALNYVKYGGFNFGANIGEDALLVALGISTITAVSEEITFRGYIFDRLWFVIDSELKANLISSFLWGLIHLPISIFWLGLGPTEVLGYFMLTTVFGIGAAFIYARTKNIVAPILLHVLWSWPIVLFR